MKAPQHASVASMMGIPGPGENTRAPDGSRPAGVWLQKGGAPLAALLVVVLSVSLAAALTAGLPWLAVLPPPPRPPSGPSCWVAPVAAALSCLLLLGWRLRQTHLGALPPERLADLPGQMFLLFLLAGLAGLLLAELLRPWAALSLRPAVVFAGAPALVLAHALMLRFLAPAPLMAVMRGRRHTPTTRPAAGPGLPGVLTIRGSMALALATCSAVGLGLVASHADSRARRERELLQERHLERLLAVLTAQVERLPPDRLPAFMNSYPASPWGLPLVADSAGRVILPRSQGKTRWGLQLERNGCFLGARRKPCAVRRLGDRQLAVLSPLSATSEVPLKQLHFDLLLLGAGLLGLATLLGWSIGRDTSLDFRAITRQLEALASQDEPDLGRPITVTSIDEVGDLTAALGRLRAHLVTELEGYRSSLRKAEQADWLRSRFFSEVSHALRTPLTTVHGNAQLLAEGVLGELSAPQKRDLGVIHQSARNLLGLINEVIDLSVIESGHLALHLETVDAAEICAELVAALAAPARRRAQQCDKQLEIELRVDAGLPPLRADPIRLRQIVQNLLSNAIEHTEAGAITLHLARREPERLAIIVEDTGCGISAADLPHIFERHRQASPGTTRRRGSGLGLGMTRHLVELHGGEISVRSEPARGTVFTVLLPLQGPVGPGPAERP